MLECLTMAKKFYITTSIPYVNAPPHIGQALEFVQADVLARYRRLKGEDVYFLTGTDENAHKNYLAAKKIGISVEQFVEAHAAKFLDLLLKLKISHDQFIRTADRKRHWPGVFKLWEGAVKNGDIYKRKYTGFYCTGCEAFVTEKDLRDKLCPIHQKEPEEVGEENYFFRLSKYQKKLEGLILKKKLLVVPESRRNEVLNFVRSGLEDLSVSRERRRVPWGIPVPNDPSQTIYVWYDALANYISALGYGTKDDRLFRKYWPADLHLIGKDIVRFHAVYWPAFLLAAGVELPKQILVHGFFTVEGRKMSKTVGNIVNPLEIISRYGAEPLRYFLLRRGALFSDADFSLRELEKIYDTDLANGLGNLVARVARLCERVDSLFTASVLRFTDARFAPCHRALENFRFDEALAFIWEKVGAVDKFIDEKKPWELEKEELGRTLTFPVGEIREIAVLLEPFLPEISRRIKGQFAGPKIKFEKPLFPRLR